MPNVVLKATGRSGTFGYSKYKITEQPFDQCLIFKRYEHRPTSRFGPDDIYVYEDYRYLFGSYVTLSPSSSIGPYKTAYLEKAHVYYNKYENRTPLLLVLFFKGHKNAKDRYYKRSVFENDISKRYIKGIDTLTPLEKDDIEGQILESLIDENDKLTNYLTYHIDRKNSLEYKNSNIKISQLTVEKSGFIKYTHTPETPDCNNKSSVLHDRQVLSWFKSKHSGLVEITEVQNILICNMEAYYSPKIKDPLMIRITKTNEDKQDHVYYFQKLITEGLFWQVLDTTSFNYLLGQNLGSNDIHNKLTDTGNKLLISALNKIERYLTKILVIMVDKTSVYAKTDVTKAFESTEFNTEGFRFVNHLGSIGVKDTTSSCKFPPGNLYTVREHDINAISETLISGESLKLVLIRSLQNSTSEDSGILTINIDYQFLFGSYYSQTRLIQVSDSYNPTHKYRWYKHSCEYEIIDGTFQLRFDGQYITLEGDLGNLSHNKAIIAYFHYDFPDRFVLVVFPDKDFKKIWYLTYSEFMKMVISKNAVQLSSLETMAADTIGKVLVGGQGYEIDHPLLDKLKTEYEQVKSDKPGSISFLDYVHGHNKLYIYSSTSSSQVLMICYADKAYTRYYLGTKSSTWKPVLGIKTCLCSYNINSFVENLNSLNGFYGWADSKKSPDQSEYEKSITINISKKGPSKYHVRTVNVSDKTINGNCMLFLHYTHTLSSEKTLNISSLKVTNPERKTINLNAQVSNAKSVTVYFNKYILTKPLILCIKSDNGSEKYYKDLIQTCESYSITQDTSISSNNLVDKLIEENDNILELLTYQVDRTTGKASHTYNGGKIQLTKQEQYPGPGFTKYTHRPVGNPLKHKACVLYSRQVLLTQDDNELFFNRVEIKQIQNVNICSMTVYYSTKIKGPLIIDLHINHSNKDKHVCYFQKKHGKFLCWQLLNADSSYDMVGERIVKDMHTKLTSDKKRLIKALEKIEISLSKILVIILDSKTHYSTEDVSKVLESETLYNHHGRITNKYGNITVSDITSKNFKNLIDDGYSVFEHDLSKISNSIQSEEYIRILFGSSTLESRTQDATLITINLDFQHEGGGYYSHSYYISVSNAHSIKHCYKWYRHNCEQKITDRTFKLGFNGQYATVEGDSSDNRLSHNIVLVYFEYFYRDSFILVAFPNLDFTKIVYLTYDKFMESILSGSTIKISQLKQIAADVKTNFLPGESGYKIDSLLLDELTRQYKKIQSDNIGSINSLMYQKGKDKFYIYTSSHGSKILMICYNDKAYTRFFLGRYRSTWKPVSGINKCICSNNFDLKDTSNKNLLYSLNSIATLQGLIIPKKLTKEDESEKSITIDISKTGPTNYESNSVTVTNQTVHDISDLFFHYTHFLTNRNTFNISSLKAGTPHNKTIKLKSPLQNVKSVNVYFSVNSSSKPIILEIVLADLTKKYYTDLINTNGSYTITENPNISSRFLDQLLEENDKKNNTMSYQIDKTINTDYSYNYGYNGSITVKKQTRDRFTIYTHRPSILSNKAYVLYGKKLLVGRSGATVQDLHEIQNKIYNSIRVYVLDIDKGLPLLIELKEKDKTTYYTHKKDQHGLHWSIESDLRVDNIKSSLDVIFYRLKESAIIEIDKGIGMSRIKDLTYPIKLIDNEVDGTGLSLATKYNQGKDLKSKNVTVSVPSQIVYSSSNNVFYYVKHEIKNQAFSANEKKCIGGLRLFILRTGESDPVELKLYSKVHRNAVRDQDRFYLYYTVGEETKIVVYFYREDNRPLVICVNSKLYKRFNDTTDQWIFAKGAACYDPKQIFETLNSVYLGMKNQFTFVDQESDEDINKSYSQPSGAYKKDIYTPDFVRSSNGPYNLTKSTLTQGITNLSILGKLFDSVISRKFDRVTKYYQDKSKPLLFEFVHDSSILNFVRIDDGKHWIKESTKKMENELEKIETNANQTIVYEVDQTDSNYNNNITLRCINDNPTTGFKKCVHTPQHNNLKISLFLYRGEKLMKKGTRGPEELKEINQHVYDNVTVYLGSKAKHGNDGHPLILELTKTGNTRSFYGIKFQNSSYYWETLSMPQPDPKNKELIKKLRETELELTESVIILTDKPFKSTYGDSDILKAIQQLKSSTKINKAKLGSNTVQVSDKTNTFGEYMGKHGFKLCEHDLSSYFTGERNCAFRFFILADESPNKYNEIKLYDCNDALDTLYYDKSGLNAKDKVYICFYGEDPRPLLLGYNGSAYKPDSLANYEKKWIREKKVTSLGRATEDNNIIHVLSEIAKFLNVVQLDKRPIITNREDEKPNTEGMYDYKYSVQKFKGKDIEIKVTYENKACYRVYKHVPYGIDGMGENFRLGNITYNPNTNTGLDYTASKQLSRVLLYYSIYDRIHENLLLVSLEFKGDSYKEYFKLKKKDIKEWEKIEDSGEFGDILKKIKDLNKMEGGLYELRKKLEINFEDKDTIRPLFKTDACTEDSVDWVAIGAGGGGGIVGVGTIVTISVVVSKKLAAAAVTTVAAAAAAS